MAYEDEIGKKVDVLQHIQISIDILRGVNDFTEIINARKYLRFARSYIVEEIEMNARQDF